MTQEVGDVEDAKAKLIETQRAEIARLRVTLGDSQQRVALLAKGLEPFASLYHEAMDTAAEQRVLVCEHPVPRMLNLSVLKVARELYTQAMLPNLSSDSDEASTLVVDVWCDGSGTSMDSEAGCGIVIAVPEMPKVERGVYLGQGTNNFAELNAIRHAVLLLDDLKVPRSAKIRVHSDSEYAIGALTKSWDIKGNAAIVADTKAVCRRYPGLGLFHVKGHAGNEGNEAADKLAGAAAASQADVFSVAQAVEIMRAHKAAQRARRATKEHKIAP
jgi:ribonuclease HI